MQDKIISLIGLQLYTKIIIIDSENLWQKGNCDSAEALIDWKIKHISDEMELRQYYECEVRGNADQRFLIVIGDDKLYVPSDIKKQFEIKKITLDTIFPVLNVEAVRSLPGVDYSRILRYISYFNLERMSREATLKFCTKTIYEDPKYALELMQKAEELAKQATTHRDWNEVAQLYGQAAHYQHSVRKLDGFAELRMSIEEAFYQWIMGKYNSLSGSVDKQRPVLLSKTADYIRKDASKVALIVMDGMSFENFYAIKEYFIREPFSFEISSSFSFLPTVTSVARQCIFSGQLPRDNTKPFSLDNEEKQWRSYWRMAGLKDQDIGFYKSEDPDYNPHMKAVGIVVNICDDLMHAELQGLTGLNQGLINWLNTGNLKRLLSKLLDDRFSIYMTSDHGNTSAIAQGRFLKPGLLAEPASRRAVIYQSFDDAPELKKFSTIKCNSSYLPDGYDAYLFDVDACYGDKDKEYITHGGMTLEEVIVPFVRIGEYDG